MTSQLLFAMSLSERQKKRIKVLQISVFVGGILLHVANYIFPHRETVVRISPLLVSHFVETSLDMMKACVTNMMLTQQCL